MRSVDAIHPIKAPHRSAASVWSAVAWACSISPAIAVEIHVPQDAPTIQAGIDLAVSGDIVVASCGTYSEALLLKSGVTIRSETGLPDCVTLDVAAGTVGLTAVSDEGVGIEGLRMTSNAALARGLAAHSSSVSLRRCEFVGLRTQSAGPSEPGGPAMRLEHQSHADVEDCLFADNSHSGTGNLGGGAIYAESSTLTIVASSFLRNSAIVNGGALSLDESTASITGSTFRENVSVFGGIGIGEPAGGAIYHDALLLPIPFLALSDCLFELNSSGLGGAVLSSTLDMQDCRVLRNLGIDGGGVWVFNGTIAQCVFSENHGDRGTALYASAGTFVRDTVLERNGCRELQCNGTTAAFGGTNFLNCTFVENEVAGDPASTAEIAYLSGSSFLILNTIVAFSEGGRPVHAELPNAQVVVQCSDFFGNSGGDFVGDVQGMNGIAGNISSDPLFCSTLQQDYALQSSSPCAPASSGACGLIGALDVGCAPIHVESSSWGAIKALHR